MIKVITINPVLCIGVFYDKKRIEALLLNLLKIIGLVDDKLGDHLGL